MDLKEKARELGRELKKTPEYEELEKANESIKNDPNASQLVEKINEVQDQISFAQQSGVEPSNEQMDQFNDLKAKMQDNLTIQSFLKAQDQFNQLMQDVNSAISEGITEGMEEEGGG